MESKREFFKCEKCGKRTKVHLKRVDVYRQGWGCTNCKTAVEVKGEYYEPKTS